MPYSVSGSLLSDFDAFLFALIGNDRNDMPLSVLSALARLDLDPWQEAGQLARLPGDRARQRLASLIAELPDGTTAPGDLATIAARLIALLPRQAGPNGGSGGTRMSIVVPRKLRDIAFVLLIVLMIVAQGIFASHRPSAQADDVLTPAASTVSPVAVPPTSRR
jgi:hypothetical protein